MRTCTHVKQARDQPLLGKLACEASRQRPALQEHLSIEFTTLNMQRCIISSYLHTRNATASCKQ